MSIWWGIDIKDGVIDHDSISWVGDDFQVTEDTVFDLSEDLLQISFNSQMILDVGWYPDLDVNGVFRVLLIKNMDWESPIVNKEFFDILNLKKIFVKLFMIR